MEWSVEGLMANGDYPWSSGGGSSRLGRIHACVSAMNAPSAAPPSLVPKIMEREVKGDRGWKWRRLATANAGQTAMT